MTRTIQMYHVTVKESFKRGFDPIVAVDLNKPPQKAIGPQTRSVVKGEVLMTVQEFITRLGKKTTSEDIEFIKEMARDVDEGGIHTYYGTGWEVTLRKA